MISESLKGYLMYINDGLWRLIEKVVLKLGFEKRGIFNKISFFTQSVPWRFLERDYFIFIKILN